MKCFGLLVHQASLMLNTKQSIINYGFELERSNMKQHKCFVTPQRGNILFSYGTQQMELMEIVFVYM